MIRFTCSNCGREYHLPDALAHLPLLCKGCGHRLAVPDPTPEPEPEPFTEPPPSHPLHTPAGTVDLFPEADTPRKPGSPKEIPDPQDSVDLFPQPAPEGGAEPPAPVKRTGNVVAVSPLPTKRGRALSLVADVTVGLLLAVLGMFLGEFATRKSTLDVLREAGSAPKFPPVDLLLWLGCVATPVLAYVLFANRGKSVGAWLRRRMEG